jgi:serine/threonine-protein kinase
MGEVYLADDARLKRQVAIKILAADANADQQSRRRLVREARAAAALDHPNICSIYEVGEDDGRAFIVMQYIQGETLAARIQRQPLGVSEALEVAIAVADGLAEAHAHGIVHRDIKPQNIMLTARGQVKILDFGLAKATTDPDVDDVETESVLTQVGAIVGTAPYMSPEQVKGQALDARSDIFSFGAVLYEMFTGRRAFAAPSVAETISAVLTSDPPPLSSHGISASEGLDQALRQCLRKDRDQRYQAIHELRLDLEALRRAADRGSSAGGGAVPEVHPAANPASSGGGVISARVALGAVLGAAVLASGLYIGFVRLPRTGGTSPEGQPVSSAAFDLYLRGKVNISNESPDNNDTAIKQLEQAVALDPSMAAAYAELARAYNVKAFYYAPDAEKQKLNEDAQVALEKALRLDPGMADAHLARGLLLWTYANRFPHDQAVQAYKRAIALNPKLDEAHHQLALVYIHVGLFEKAETEIELALAANPANTMARFRSGVIDLYRGRYEAALAIFDSTPLNTNPLVLTFQKATALFQLGRIAEATTLVDESLAASATDEGGTVTSVKAMLLAKAGDAPGAEKTIQRAIEIGRSFGHFHHTAYNIASAYALLGKPAEALRWLQTAADDGLPCYPLFAQDHNFDSLRTDERFITFLARMKARLERYEATL